MTGPRLARLLLLAAFVASVLLARGIDPPWSAVGGYRFFAPDPFPGLVITIHVALWWAATACAVLCALLFATAGVWAAPLPARPAPVPGPAPVLPHRGRRIFVLLLCAAALLGCALRWNLFGSGFFHDEAWTLKKAIIGEWVDPKGGGEPVFEPLPWRKTFWAWRRSTNHVGFSVASRAVTEAWQALQGLPQQAFDERVVRLPSLVACGLGIAALGVLVAAYGFPRAGVFAAFLLAVHPWHVEFGTAARGYGLMVLLAILAALALLRGLRTGAWGAWLAGAAALAGMLWCQPVSLYLALSLGAAVLAGALAAPGSRRLRLLLAARFAVACLLAAMALGLLFAPNLAQIPHQSSLGGSIASGAVAPFWTLIAWGLPLHAEARYAGLAFPSYESLAAGRPWLAALTWGALPALAAVGLLALWRRAGATRWVALGLVLCAPLAPLVIRLLQAPLYERFLLFALPGILPLLAVGSERLLVGLARLARRREGIVVPVGLALALLGFAAMARPQLAMLLARPYSGERATVRAIARAAREAGTPVRSAGLGLGGHMPKVYDPHIRWLGSVRDVRAACREARRDAMPLYVFYGYEHVNRGRFPEAFEWLDDPELFEPIGTYPGVRSEYVFRLFRYRGGPLSGARREGG